MAVRQISFVTTRPVRLARVHPVLRAVGLWWEPIVMSPQQWCDSPTSPDGSLVFFDGPSALAWERVAAPRGTAASRFVLCSKTVTPGLVRMAMDCGMDGVLSTRLAVEDAALALLRICRGKRQFRFEATTVLAAPAPTAPPAEFDRLWMFGEMQGI